MRSIVTRVSFSNQVAAIVRSPGNIQSVFQLAHHRAVFALPTTFGLGLIKVVVMVAKDMVQQPKIGCRAGMQCITQFENSIERRPVKSFRVLVMMIPGADASLRNNHDDVVR